MKILLVAATPFEIAPTIQYLESQWTKKSFFDFVKEDKEVATLVTGVGAINTAVALSRYTSISNVDVLINAGIAGAFGDALQLGSVVEIERDRYGDIGVEEADGTFHDMFDMNWVEANNFPYTNGWLANTTKHFETDLPKVSGITVNCVSGNEVTINKITSKYNPHVESMEGAAIHHIALINQMKFRQIRSISNKVAIRDKTKWKVEEAIDKLNSVLIELIHKW